MQYRTRGVYCYIICPSSPISAYLWRVLHIPPSALPPPCSEALLWFGPLIWMICHSFLTSPSAPLLTPLQPILHRKLEWSFKIKMWSYHPLSFFILFTGFPSCRQEKPKGWILAWYSLAYFHHFCPAPLGSCHTGLLSAPKMYQSLLTSDPLNLVFPLPPKSVPHPTLLFVNSYSSFRFQCQYYFFRMNHSNEFRFPYCFLS